MINKYHYFTTVNRTMNSLIKLGHRAIHLFLLTSSQVLILGCHNIILLIYVCAILGTMSKPASLTSLQQILNFNPFT